MGTWGHGPFESDDTCDWLAELEADGMDAVRDALSPGSSPSASDDALTIVAAEVIAAIGGRPTEGLPDEVTAFAATHPTFDRKLVKTALSALKRVLDEDSELYQLWAESGDADEWRASVKDLRRRLKSLIAPSS